MIDAFLNIKFFNGSSYNNIAVKYAVGEDVKRDINKAIKYYKKAIAAGYTAAANDLFCVLVDNKKDVDECLKILEAENTPLILSNQSIMQRDFHHRILPKVLELINVINTALDTTSLTVPELASFAKGLSKLRLSTKIKSIDEVIEKFYSQVFERREELLKAENYPVLIR